jgi:hypothetical protein
VQSDRETDVVVAVVVSSLASSTTTAVVVVVVVVVVDPLGASRILAHKPVNTASY